MRQVGEQHPVAPGVLAICLPKRESGTDLKDQVVLRNCSPIFRPRADS